MNEISTLAIKAIDGGLFVVIFALVGEVARPKRFAGLFSAAPSVALANLIVVIAVKGSKDAAQNLVGMLAGATALVAVCALGVLLIPRLRAARASVALCLAWLVVAEVGFLVFLR